MLEERIHHGAHPAPNSDAEGTAADVRSETLPHTGCPLHSRNLFSGAKPTLSEKRFRGLGRLTETVQELAPLARAMCKPGTRDPNGDLGVPAGYTYLAQLVAHDVGVRAGGTVGGAFNYQSKAPDDDFLKPMTLSSVYGPVNDESAVADPDHLGFCRVHEFERTRARPDAMASFDYHRDADSRASVYDGRNDDLPMLSQTCALFLGLHNYCAERLISLLRPDDVFRFARLLTTDVYQRIVREDMFAALLHPGVNQHYKSGDVLIDRTGSVSPLPAVECTHGTFRFGHAMVRPFYHLQENRPPITLGDLLNLPGNLVEIREHDPAFWRVDMRLFFGESDGVQKSGPLQPAMAPFFAESSRPEIEIGEEFGTWRDDLAMRDLARSVDGGLLSVPALIEHLTPYFCDVEGFGDWLSFQTTNREAALRAWLEASVDSELPEPVMRFLCEDPPLSFYVLFEAALPVEQGGGGKKSLGVLGSILMAESVLPSIAGAGLSFGDGPKFLKAQGVAFGQDGPPSTMSELLSLLS